MELSVDRCGYLENLLKVPPRNNRMKLRRAHDLRRGNNIFVSIILLCLIPNAQRHIPARACCCDESNHCSKVNLAWLILPFMACHLEIDCVNGYRNALQTSAAYVGYATVGRLLTVIRALKHTDLPGLSLRDVHNHHGIAISSRCREILRRGRCNDTRRFSLTGPA
jgi:hypothetical protein